MDLLPREDLQPAGQMLVVQTPLQGLVTRVDVALAEQEVLQGLVGLMACQAVVEDLGVVGDKPFGRLTREGEGHLGPVPGQASLVVLLHVKVVHLTEGKTV
ncbi:hypothetical protein INR49_018177, partial [Caranx melampygus]